MVKGNENSGRRKLTDEYITEVVFNKSHGRYNYIPDEKFEVKNRYSLILLHDTIKNVYTSKQYSHIVDRCERSRYSGLDAIQIVKLEDKWNSWINRKVDENE